MAGSAGLARYSAASPEFVLILALACVGGDPDSADDTGVAAVTLDPATVPLYGECEMADDRGGFSVVVAEAESSVDGAVADGVVPASVLEELYADGGCSVLRRNEPYCESGCDPGEACAFDGTCVPYPANQDLGTVTISGLSHAVAMEPVFPGNTYYDTTFDAPAFAGGELIALSMPAGAYGPADLYGVGVEALDVSGTTWSLQEGTDLAVEWPAPTGDVVRSEIALSIAIDQHGVTPSSVRCVFADAGAATVPGAVVTALVGAGVTGFPSATMTRRTVDRAAAGDGCMDLTVASPRSVAVDVLGYTPCVSDAECPEGEACDEKLQICE